MRVRCFLFYRRQNPCPIWLWILTWLSVALVDPGGHLRAEPPREKHIADSWCQAHHGESEVVLPDRTRCDCVTDQYAVEVEWADNWMEAIGQALWYGAQTGKKPGIVLIIRCRKDDKYWIKLKTTISMYSLSIRVWRVNIYDGGEKTKD